MRPVPAMTLRHFSSSAAWKALKLAAQGDEVKVDGPARFQAFSVAELEKWRRVITSAGLKLD